MGEPAADAPTIIAFLSKSDHENINDMARDFAAAVEEFGYAVALVDTRLASFPKSLVDVIARRDIAFVFSVNGIGLPTDDDIAGYFDDRNIAFFSYFVDHPAFVLDRFRTRPQRFAYSFPSPGHIDFCRRFVDPTVPVLHLAHAAAPRPSIPWSNRDVAVTFAGTLFFDPARERAAWRDRLGDETAARLEAIIERYDSAVTDDLADLVLAVIGQDAADEVPPSGLVATMRTVDDYLRCRVKAEGIASLSGLAATVIGRGWSDFEGVAKDSRLLGEMPARQALAELNRARVALNLLPRYYHSHERIFQAAAGGVAPLTTPAPYLAAIMGSQALLQIEDPRTAGAAAEMLLKDGDGLAAMAEAANQAWAGAHTWRHRAARIVDTMVDEFACPAPPQGPELGR